MEGTEIVSRRQDAKGGSSMQAPKEVLAARALLESVTPLKRDCGRVCGVACCQSDEDGQGGMLLFPGEEALYDPLPPGFSMQQDDGVLQGALLITCAGRCEREKRPLSCRLFPLLPSPEGAVLDQRAWAVCPLMESGIRGLNPDFVQAVNAAGALLYRHPGCAALLSALHAYNERLKMF